MLEVLQVDAASVVVHLGIQVDDTFSCDQTAAWTSARISPSSRETSCLFCPVVATFTVRGGEGAETTCGLLVVVEGIDGGDGTEPGKNGMDAVAALSCIQIQMMLCCR